MFTIPVSNKETNTWLAWDLVLFGNTGGLHQRWRSDTTTPSCMAGANCGRHGSRWQIWPDRSCSDQPRQGHSVLWVVIIRRRTELGQGTRCCVHAVRNQLLGLQTSPTQHQTGKPGWWLAVDCPSHRWRDTSNQEGLVALVPFCLCQHHSIFVIKTCLCDQQTSQQLLNDGRCPDLATNHYIRNEVRHHSEAKFEARGNKNYGWPIPVTFTLLRLLIGKWPKFSVNFLISVVNVWEIGRF